ncbi:U2 snRNP-associated SURP motif-containing protein isoform X2 [Xyrichtys novacula]|uniref:U2 snRNP-associated SURP motif-containing protein isoform X2 n=1 Tax=Xyrichtys novacula TaxID=13765 RepID=A0AAV1FSW4_XYRNO|nr:U2 snRNP-associated SURP motif-containing protein isoform X2 [Xyrichtys novacula]
MADRKGKPATPVKLLTQKKLKELKKKEQEKAAEVFEEFVASFEANKKPFVHGGVVNATKEEEAAVLNKIKLYRHPTKLSPVSQRASSVSAADSKKTVQKRSTEGKQKSNLELFKEELKIIQEEREERYKRKKNVTGGEGREGGEGEGGLCLPSAGRSIYDEISAPATTNLFISRISQKMNEEMLCQEFCKYGPLASVRIMWPRNSEERLRISNRAFVAFMMRKDAERALAGLEGKKIMGFVMKMGWAKPVRIPRQPVYTSTGVRATMPPHSGLPFNAQPIDRFRNDFTKPLDTDKEDLDKTLSKAVVQVVIPKDRSLLSLIHRMVEFVVREGFVFEALIMNKEIKNPEYRFLFDNKSQDHVYYRWKLFSILQADSQTEWRTTDFCMFRGGSMWRPPIPVSHPQRGEDSMEEEDASSEEEVKRGQLRAKDKQRLETLLTALTPSRKDIIRGMLFCLERADAAEEVVRLITESFSWSQAPLSNKIARLYLVSDILHNSFAKVAGASYYRRHFEKKLTQIIRDLNAAHRNIQSRLQAEQFQQKVLNCVRAWQEWDIYPDYHLLHLQNICLGLVYVGEESTETPEDASSGLDGVPMVSKTTCSNSALMDDLDGCPIGWNLDGDPVDDIDGVPLEVAVDDIDGMPLDDNGVPLSKWEKRDNTHTFFPAETESKWDMVLEDREDEVNVSIDSQDGDKDSHSDDSGSSAKYDSEDFQSSLRSFHKGKRLRELEVKFMKIQDELESGKRPKKSGMSVQPQVQHYRDRLLQKEFEKDEGKNGRLRSKSKDRSKDDRRHGERRRRSKDRGRRQRSTDLADQIRQSRSISPSKKKSVKQSKRSRSPSPDRKTRKSRSRSPHRSRKKTKRSKH